jgi:hypothetical protein
MERDDQRRTTIGKTTRAWVVTGALALGAAAGAAGIANAASGGSDPSPGQPPGGGNPAEMRHGPGETVLTDAAASKARAAALAAVPGATVSRVETDSAGAAYEAHLRKSDGTFVTVKLEKGFHVTGTQSGFGAPSQ